MECSTGPSAAPPKHEPSWEYHLRKYLMLLATLVATATYAAGLSPPGGVWQETSPGDHPHAHEAGDPILYHSPRYLAFFYFNATAFAASLVVNLLLLVLNEKRTAWLAALRVVMVLDLLGLMGAFATGSCEDVPTTVYVSTLLVALAAYVGIHILLAWYEEEETSHAAAEVSPDDALRLKEQRKVLLLLATFATGISYAAGLSPPGGFRDDDDTEGGHHHAGDPMLKAGQSPRLMAFFYCNATAFVASLLIIVLLLGRRLQRYCARMQLYGFILVVLLGLLGAYAAGSSREADTTAYVVVLVAVVPVYIFLVMVIKVLVSDPLKNTGSWLRLKSISARASLWLQERGCHQNQADGNAPARGESPAPELLATLGGGDHELNVTSNKNEGIEKAKSLILLLATLAATITYQAGMDPPGGVWEEADPDGRYKAGDPILLLTNARRYKVFFYCNSTAFVASLVVILMVQNRSLIRGHALEVAMILDLFGLIGAYAAGSCRDVSTSIYVMALAGAVLVYVVIHVVFFTLHNEDLSDEEKRMIDKRRKRLLLLAILVATITYQAGLTPPGGFWTEDGETKDEHRYYAGSAILSDHHEYRRRYLAFFYCNSTSFMASVALIIMLVNPNLYRPGIRCYALYVCMVVALFGLMGAYAAGSARQLQTSIYVFVLVGAVVAFIVLQLLVFFKFFKTCAPANGDGSGSSNANEESSSSPQPRRASVTSKPSTKESSSTSSRRKYLMLLAILAASVTYQAGLKPPGGVSEDGDAAGSPVLRVSDPARYQAFFYCNSTSFVASVVVIVLLLQESLQDRRGLLIYAMNTAIVLDLLGLLGAYAAGSSREWDTSGYVIALAAAVFAYVAVHLVVWLVSGRRGRGRVSSSPQQLPVHAETKGTRRCSSSPC
uniref:Uncharacterized protein n=1 Tax=Avena sativa TaxID=4498 RepID=A0ACD5VCF3_AVESA